MSHAPRVQHPKAKGLAGRANGYLETSFLPGRRFAGPADFNAQLKQWLTQANARQHRVLGCRPADRWSADKAAMLELPPVAPVTGWRLSTRLPHYRYVRLDSNYYSVDPSVIVRIVEVAAGLDEVRVTCGNRLLASHLGCWAAHQSITDPAHAAAAAQLRQARQLAAARPADTAVQQRALSDYDRVFGISDQGAA